MMGRVKDLERENRYLRKLLRLIEFEASDENVERMMREHDTDFVFSYILTRVTVLSSYAGDRKGAG